MNYGPRLQSAPRRQMVVSDPTKLSYFAQAQTSRFGIQHGAGALMGLGSTDTSSAYNFVPGSGADGNAQVIAEDVTAAPPKDSAEGIMNTVATVSGSFLSTLLGGGKPPPPSSTRPPPAQQTSYVMPIVIGVAAVGIGFILWRKR